MGPTSPPRQLRAGAAPTKLGKPRVALPVSVQSTDTLWDAAAQLVPSSPPAMPNLDAFRLGTTQTEPDALYPVTVPGSPVESEAPAGNRKNRPSLELDLSSLPQPRRRVRKDHLARCVTLQHGMLRESISAGPDDVLSRLSLYDDSMVVSAGGVNVEDLIVEEDERDWANGYAYHSGPKTAPVLDSRVNKGLIRSASHLPPTPPNSAPNKIPAEVEEYFPTMAELLAMQDEEEDQHESFLPIDSPHRVELQEFRFPASPARSQFPSSAFPVSPTATNFAPSRRASTVLPDEELFFQPDPPHRPAESSTRSRSPSPRRRSPSPRRDSGAQYITMQDEDTRTLYAETIDSTSMAAHMSHVPPFTATTGFNLSPPPSAVPSISPTIAYEQGLGFGTAALSCRNWPVFVVGRIVHGYLHTSAASAAVVLDAFAVGCIPSL
ncbi:hypothetical protein EXIGLDRAFT_782094 [Exidia glandulosa HHB12029]|uniref:Uncharacterized protein n=1 Tax=Exidia glandulosa HHB12029 TaxID=1314781 RepID=A0A165B025_EXIGL|nr:hypothetical protein EXIGLDRAFT_782094 [Exidia glandulosa HHB12029]